MTQYPLRAFSEATRTLPLAGASLPRKSRLHCLRGTNAEYEHPFALTSLPKLVIPKKGTFESYNIGAYGGGNRVDVAY